MRAATPPLDEDYHCTRCMHLVLGDTWPKTCPACGKEDYDNPKPAAVLLVPYHQGVLGVRRAIAPGIGELALPGGYVNRKEPWKVAGARELDEELNLRVHPNTIEDFAVRDALAPNVILIFGLAPQINEELPPFVPNEEVSERVILRGGEKLAFPMHEEIVALYFGRRLKR